jgi:hypothetical protein
MNIKQYLEKKGWTPEKVSQGRRMVTALRHPNQPLLYLVQAHEFRARNGLRTIARISSRNLVHDTVNDLLIVDGFIAIKA